MAIPGVASNVSAAMSHEPGSPAVRTEDGLSRLARIFGAEGPVLPLTRRGV